MYFDHPQINATHERFVTLVKELHGIDPSEHIFKPQKAELSQDKDYRTLGFPVDSIEIQGVESLASLSKEESIDYALMFLAKRYPEYKNMLESFESLFFTVTQESGTDTIAIFNVVPAEHKEEFVHQFYDLMTTPAEITTPEQSLKSEFQKPTPSPQQDSKEGIFNMLETWLLEKCMIFPALDETAYADHAGREDYSEVLVSLTDLPETSGNGETIVDLQNMVSAFANNAETIVPHMEDHGAFIFDISDQKPAGQGSPDSPFAKRAYFHITVPGENRDAFLASLEETGMLCDVITEGDLKNITALEMEASGGSDDFRNFADEDDDPSISGNGPSQKPVIH